MKLPLQTLATTAVLSAFFSIGAPAYAQQTVQDLLNHGGKKLSQSEILDLLVGKTFVRKNKHGNDINVEVVPDGTVKGYVSSYLGTAGLSGTWTLSDDGRMCVDYLFTDANLPRSGWCGFHFTAESKYFFADSDTSPEAQVREWWLQ